MAEHELNKIVDDDGEVFNLRDSTKQPTADRVTAWGSTPSDTKYPSEKLVKTSLDAKADDSAVVHKAGEENITGNKVFKNGVEIFSTSENSGYGIFVLPSTNSGADYNNWPNEYKDGAHFREWTLHFPADANFWGRIRITFLGGYNSFNASGSISKTILCAFNGSSVYNNNGAYDALGINTENEFRISDLIWDNTNGYWTIKIHSIKPTSNNKVLALRIEFGCRNDYVSVARQITWSSTTPSIVTDTTYYTKRSGNASTSPATGGVEFNWADKPVFQSPYGYEIFDRSHTIPIGNGGTGQTNATAAQYALLNPKCSELTAALEDDYRIMFASTSPSTSVGVFVGFRKASAFWTYIKGKISSVLGLSESNGVKTFTGNAATASALSAGADRTKLDGIAAGAEVNVQSDWNQATTTADDYIKNKPTLGTAAAKDVPTSGNASTTQVVMGNDSRLTDARTPTAHTHTADAADVVDQPGDSVITDSTDIITTHVNGYSSTNKKLYKRNFKDYVWPWIKDKISSVLGLSTTGYTGNAATATKATQDSDGNAINATYFKSSGNTTLVAGAATKIGTQNGADVKLTLPAHQNISGKMNTSANNAASGALQNLTGQLTEGTSDFTDKTEIFTSYAGNNGFAESGHVNQPYRRKASSMLNYIESKRFYTRNPAQNDVGTGTKRIQLGYALKTGAGYCNYLVHVFFNSVAGSLVGCGVTLLVNYDWNTTSQKAKCVILNDNGLRAAGYNIVLANFLSNDGTNQWMHITLGLVNNSAPGTLVAFTYSYCGIFRVNSDVNWFPSIASDTVGSYDQLVQAVLTDADTVDGYHIQFGSYSSRSDTISFY